MKTQPIALPEHPVRATLLSLWKRCGGVPGWDVLEDPEVGVLALRSPVREGLHCAWGSPVPAVEQRLLEWFGEMPFEWTVPADEAPAAARRMQQAGFRGPVAEQEMILGAEGPELVQRILAGAGVLPEVVGGGDPRQLEAWSQVVGEVFESNVAEVFLFTRVLLEHGARALLMRQEGQPAAAALVTPDPESTGLWFIGTLPEFRGRGLARIVMARAIQDALEGGSRCICLQAASAEVAQFHAGLGFRVYGEGPSFHWEGGES